MALIKCTECGKEISDSAELCPNCGCKTRRGTTVAEAKNLLANYVIVVVLMVVGLILFFPSLSELMDHSSYYWDSGYWRHDDDTIWAIFKVAVGAGLALGGIVDMVMIYNKSKDLNASAASRGTMQTDQTALNDAAFIPVAFIPEEKRQLSTCAMCKAEGMVADCKIPNQFGTQKLCPKCIIRYNAKIQ